MRTFIDPSASDWSEIARIYLGPLADRTSAGRLLVERLRQRHDSPGLEVLVQEGQIEVRCPVPAAGLEDGWELLPEVA